MKRRILTWSLFSLLLLIAVGIMLYPLVSSYVNEKTQSIIRTEYLGKVTRAETGELLEAWEAAAAYNDRHKPIRYNADSVTEAETDYDHLLNIKGNGVMGYLEIPKICASLPIYHGTDAETLERGVGHLLGSSLPVGGDAAHCVLTGHSGMSNQRLFTDLELLSEGDLFYLHILDRVLAYQVDAIRTVEPYDTEQLYVINGRDLCTLVTCTPYGVNSHRLLVRGTRIPYEAAEEIKAQEETVEASESIWMRQYLKGLSLGLGGLSVFAIVALTVAIVRKRRRSHAT